MIVGQYFEHNLFLKKQYLWYRFNQCKENNQHIFFVFLLPFNLKHKNENVYHFLTYIQVPIVLFSFTFFIAKIFEDMALLLSSNL